MKKMPFASDTYDYLSQLIIDSKRPIINFTQSSNGAEGIIIRHDVDFCPQKATKIANIEYKKNIQSTFFFLVDSGLYNISSTTNINCINKIISMGHNIGLHFDAGKYNQDKRILNNNCKKQLDILESLIGIELDIISFHRPNKNLIGMSDKLANKRHTYMPMFINDMKYCSDSGGEWKYDDPETIINNKNIKNIQLLTHPIWWTTPKNLSAGEKVAFHLKGAKKDIHLIAAENCIPYKAYLKNNGIYYE